jgi:preprotein translocase subunit Sec61beta
MAQKNKGPGIQSAAGLIRYFDAEEDTAFKIAPSAVIIFAVIVGLAVLGLMIFYPL